MSTWGAWSERAKPELRSARREEALSKEIVVRALMGVAAVGVLGVVLWKVLWVMLLPLFATVLGVFITVLKFALIGAAVYVAYRLYRRYVSEPAEPAS